jgi:hypothetical protein
MTIPKAAELETAESGALERWDYVSARIADAGNPPTRATRFRMRLLQPPDSDSGDGWTVRELEDLLYAADQALAEIERFRKRLDEMLDKRDSLRRRLNLAKVRAGAGGFAEDIELGDLYEHARGLLWGERPCDLKTAEAAVRRYEDTARRRLAEGHGEVEG